MKNAILITVLAVLGSACISVTQTAGHGRVPVLLGPVTCVGCPPRQVPPPVMFPTLQDSTSVFSMVVTIGNTTTSSYGGKPSELDLKLYEIRDPCHQEVVLQDVEASSFGLFALGVLYTSSSLDVSGDQVTVPTGSCDLTIVRWPLAGPRGIHWPIPPRPAMPPAAPPIPPQPASPPAAAPTVPSASPPPAVPVDRGQP
jgi:hypothetical protein